MLPPMVARLRRASESPMAGARSGPPLSRARKHPQPGRTARERARAPPAPSRLGRASLSRTRRASRSRDSPQSTPPRHRRWSVKLPRPPSSARSEPVAVRCPERAAAVDEAAELALKQRPVAGPVGQTARSRALRQRLRIHPPAQGLLERGGRRRVLSKA
jgi:hypothetical protein